MGDGVDGFDDGFGGFGQDTTQIENAALGVGTSIIRGIPRLLGLEPTQPAPVQAQSSGLPFGLSIGALIVIGVGAYLLLARR